MKIRVPRRAFTLEPLGNDAIDNIVSLFLNPIRTKEIIMSIAKKMDTEFKNVIMGNRSVIKKTNTFIQNFPNGKEKGDFLGVHFSDGIIEMAGMSVEGRNTLKTIEETVVVPEEERLLRGTERVLFVAKCLKQFSRRMRYLEPPDVGPMWKIGVNYGYLKVAGRMGLSSIHSDSWPDEYNFTGKPVRMRNLRQKIIAAADSIGFNIEIEGFLHTPEAVFLDSIWTYPSTIGALSLDHRCTSCVMEETSKVRKISSKDDDRPYMLLNIHWGTFGDGGELDEILTDFDKEEFISKSTGHNEVIERKTFGKIVSETNIIRLLRLVLLTLSEQGVIFKSSEANRSRIKNYLQESTHRISSMARSYSRGDHVENTFRLDFLAVEDSIIINRVVQAISWRASTLLALIMYVHLKNVAQSNDSPVFLVNGSYSDREIEDIVSALDYILGLDESLNGKKLKVEFSSRSHIFGAAVLAAIYSKNRFDYDEDHID